jgi:hypothetical protein
MHRSSHEELLTWIFAQDFTNHFQNSFSWRKFLKRSHYTACFNELFCCWWFDGRYYTRYTGIVVHLSTTPATNTPPHHLAQQHDPNCRKLHSSISSATPSRTSWYQNIFYFQSSDNSAHSSNQHWHRQLISIHQHQHLIRYRRNPDKSAAAAPKSHTRYTPNQPSR